MPVVLALVVLALVLPKHSAAQAVMPADLVGSWALPDSTEFGYIFRADSTMRYVTQTSRGTAVITGRWRLASDTLVVSAIAAKVNGRPTAVDFGRRVVALQKTRLTVTRTDSKKAMVFERVDSLANPGRSVAPADPKP